MMFPFGSSPSAPPPAVDPPLVDSNELTSRKNISDRLFQAICASVGGVAVHFVRSSPQYFPLLVVGSLFASGFLAFIPPRDKEFLGLYRSGAVVLLCGVLLACWDFLTLISLHFFALFVVGVVCAAIALVAAVGRG